MRALYLITAAALTWLSAEALIAGEGHETGNGGIAYVCRGPDARSILTAELLDLWEGSKAPQDNGYGIKIARTEAPVAEQVERAVEKLASASPLLGTQVKLAFKQTMRDWQAPIDTVELADTKDAGKVPAIEAKTGCAYEQLAVYTFRGKLFINTNLYESLDSETDRAALFLHEAIYKVFRASYNLYEFLLEPDGLQSLGSNSRVTRHLVATLFSDTKLVPVAVVDANDRMACSSEQSGFDLEFLISRDRDLIEFTRIGAPVVSRAQTVLSGALKSSSLIQTNFPVLGPGARFSLRPTKKPLEYIASSTGGELKIPEVRVHCSAKQ